MRCPNSDKISLSAVCSIAPKIERLVEQLNQARRSTMTLAALAPAADAPPPQVVYLQNWVDEMKRTAPAG